MTFIAAAAIGSVALGAYGAIKGANQSAAAKKLAQQNQFTPEYMPSEVKQATNLAGQNYTNGMPGYGNQLQNIRNNGASAFYNGSQAASSGGDLLDLAGKIGYSQNVATNQLGQQAAQYKAQALGGYENALGNQANWQKQLYNNNTLQPYLRTANLAASMYGAGQQNLYNGLDSIASTGVGLAKAYGGGNSGSSATQQTMGQVNGSPTLSAQSGGILPSNNSISVPSELMPTNGNPNQYNYGVQWNAPLQNSPYRSPYFPYNQQ